jgi:RNA polymerase sigma-70 factor (ECF subfamily)
MHESAGRHPGLLVTFDAALEREFEDLLRESASLAVRVAYGILKNPQDAEETAQEAFARAYRRFGQLRDRSRFRAWLIRMTWRLAIDRWRSDRRRMAREQTSISSAVERTSEQVASENERSKRLWAAIDDLPEKLRIAIVLSAIQGYDVREVSQLLDVPEGTVKSRLFLARKALAQRLQCLVNDTRPR